MKGNSKSASVYVVEAIRNETTQPVNEPNPVMKTNKQKKKLFIFSFLNVFNFCYLVSVSLHVWMLCSSVILKKKNTKKYKNEINVKRRWCSFVSPPFLEYPALSLLRVCLLVASLLHRVLAMLRSWSMRTEAQSEGKAAKSWHTQSLFSLTF